MNFRIFLALLIVQLSAWCPAQKLPQIDSQIAQKNLVAKVEPCYPPVAKFAHVYGNVIVGVAVGKDGRVDAAQVLNGPAMLQNAALRAARQYEYKPFEQDGQPIQVATKVLIAFPLSPNDLGCKANDGAWRAYAPFQKKCAAALNSQPIDRQLFECKTALDFAVGAPPGNHRGEVAEAHRKYGTALLNAGRPQEALPETNDAVMNARRYLDASELAYADAFSWRGFVFDALGQDEKAAADYSISETSYRQCVQRISDERSHLAMGYIFGPSLLADFKANFTMVLNKHAALLDKKGEKSQAEALRDEAAKVASFQNRP